ncbi:hypothetical protein KJE20_06366 [Pyrenophora tritici-repentis]|nr:hypothetical protein KJE20_06366 [Pyrenophora tritici-repentis]
MEPSTPTSPSPSNIIRLDLTSLTPSPIPTSSPTPILSPTPIQYHESPDEFVQGGITYVKRAIIARKDFRQGTSHIWKYGLQYIRDSDKKEVYYCHECRVGKSKQELFVINGTSRIRNHLEQKHQIDPQSGIKRKGSVRKSIIDQQKDGAASSIFFWKESVEKFKELLIRWIVYCHIAFFQLENQYFRELLLFLNPALLNHLPKAAKTIRSWVMNAFISKKQQLREDLHHSRSRISISFDLWTSPNPYAILGVVAMWIDTTGMRRVTALGMRRIYGEHTGENLGSVVLELLEEYDISGDQIGYFMLDNASANDTAVEFILKDLCPWMKSKQRRHRRLRCLGHVINLCCQAFLMGRNCEKYLAKLEKHHQRGDYTKVEELWKKFGCLGRLHNLVRYIRLTPQRREEFATIIIGGDLSQFDGLELIQNNSTRWNSWFYSITRALNVRERLELFSARHVPGKGSVGIANFKLDGQHWFELEKIELALKDFYAATLLSEGKKTSLADWFSTLDCLLREISETKDHYHDIHTEDDNNFTWKYLQGCADAAWLKCVEYYNNQQLNWQNRFPEDTDLPPAYYAAQILDPYRKWGWFRQEWVLHGDEEKKRWFENAQLAVKHLWETEYKGRYPVEMLPPPARKERDPDPAFDRQREHKRIRIDAPVSTTDLYEQYISTDRLHNEEAGCNEAIAYWLSRYDSQRDLARFALDMFAISPMSDECERLFSSAKLTIVDRRDQTIPITGKDQSKKAQEAMDQLKQRYSITGGDDLQWFLGIEVIRDRSKQLIHLSQVAYYEKINRLVDDQTIRHDTPMATSELMPREGLATPSEINRYQRKIGSLLYAAVNTRPDIAFATSRLARFLANPSQEHQQAADRVLLYLSDTKWLTLRLGGGTAMQVASDASFADNTLDRKSSQGYAIKLFGGLIAWRSSKQDTVTTSTTEAELLALSQVAKEAIFTSRLISELKVKLPSPTITIQCDNQQTIRLVTQAVSRLTTKLRHVDIHNHWLRQEVTNQRIKVVYTKSSEMIADGLTKVLPVNQWTGFLIQLGLVEVRDREPHNQSPVVEIQAQLEQLSCG